MADRIAEKRALNIVWGAAGEYGFQPEFLAYSRDGQPDIYLNTIVGIASRDFDRAKLKHIFDRLEQTALGSMYTDIFWLALEGALFKRELPNRPVLEELRRIHAERFLAPDADRSMQQRMMESSVGHDLQTGWWRMALGDDPRLVNPWEKRLLRAIVFPADITLEEAEARMDDIIRRFFVLDFSSAPKRGLGHMPLPGFAVRMIKKLLPMRRIESDDFFSRHGGSVHRAEGGRQMTDSAASKARHAFGVYTHEETRGWIEDHFGPPLFSDREMQRLDASLCRGTHAGCHVWFSESTADVAGTSEAYDANMAYYGAHSAESGRSMRAMRDMVKNAVALHRHPVPVRARTGLFSPRDVWRALYAHDMKVFTVEERSPEPDFSVSLMLDASASREPQQGIIAAQAYIIAQALSEIGVPLSVFSFCSLRGYTALQVLQRSSLEASRDIFRYRAAGWNRDGLALRGAAELLSHDPAKRHILLWLTDVNPSDDTRVRGAGPLTYSYSEKRAIDDAALEAAALRRRGTRIIGILNGELPGYESAAHAIFGSDFTCIRELGQLAARTSALLIRQIMR